MPLFLNCFVWENIGIFIKFVYNIFIIFKLVSILNVSEVDIPHDRYPLNTNK